MNKHERAAALIQAYKELTGKKFCFDEAVQQIIYDFRAYCALMNVDIEKKIEASKHETYMKD